MALTSLETARKNARKIHQQRPHVFERGENLLQNINILSLI